MRNETLSRAISGGIAVAALTFGGVALSASSADAAPSSPWDAIARCESGGNWSIDTGNGYYGGLQFSAATWAAYGGHGSAATASRARQIAVGKRVVAVQGWSAWSGCSRSLGLQGHGSPTWRTAPRHTTGHRAHPAATSHRAAGHKGTEPSVRSADAERSAHHRAGPRHAAHRAGRHAAAPAVSGRTYTVKTGDTLAAIAAHLHVTGGWRALADANAAHLAHPDDIVPGQVLHLPAHRAGHGAHR